MDDRRAARGLEKTSTWARRATVYLLGVLATALAPGAAQAQSVYVASSGTNAVTAIDARTMAVKGKPIPVGAQPTALAVTPDGKIVIATVLAKKDGERVVVIDAVRNQKQRFWKPFGPPIGVAIEPQVRSEGRRVAHVLVKDGPFGPGISQFNLKRMVWIHFIRGRKDPKLMAVTPDGARIYVPGTDRRSRRAYLSEFDFFFGSGQSHTGLRDDIGLSGGAISALGITPDSRFVVVVTQDASGGGIINTIDRTNNNHLDAQSLGEGAVPHHLAIGRNASGIFGLLTTDRDLVQLSASGAPAAITANAAHFPGNFVPDNVAITPDGTAAYVTDGAGPSVAKLSVSRGVGAAKLTRLPDGTAPTALAISPDGKFVFVAQGDSTGGGNGVVSRIDVSTDEVKSVAVQGQPVVLAIGPGAPGSSCPDQLHLCADKCVNLAGDRANCGACGHVCPAGDVCTSGRCECPRGRAICGELCLDIETDRANCGRCGRVCIPGDVCVSGQCVCPAGKGVCNDQCVDEATDRRNCGRCGNVCAPDEVCSAGRCTCPPGRQVCNGVCTETETNRANCGRCGHACIPGDICVSGSCVCPAGRNVCSDQCVNLAVNLRNCGTCGRVCLPGDSCVSGRCVCPEGHKVCRDRCVNIETDTSNCGACGHACAAGQTCVNGRCG